MFFSLSFSRFSTMKFFLSFCWGEPENLLLDELNFFLPVSCVPSGTASRAAFVSWSLFFPSSSVHSFSSCFQVRILILISCFCWISWEINDTGPQSLKWPFWKIKMFLLVQSGGRVRDQHCEWGPALNTLPPQYTNIFPLLSQAKKFLGFVSSSGNFQAGGGFQKTVRRTGNGSRMGQQGRADSAFPFLLPHQNPSTLRKNSQPLTKKNLLNNGQN